MVRTCFALVVLGVSLTAAPALAKPNLKFDPPAGNWKSSTADDGTLIFSLQAKKARATIALHPAEASPEGAAEFAREVAESPSPDFIDRSEVQTFTSPDGRAVVAVDGKASTGTHAPGRQCWVFHNGHRTLAQFVAGDAAEFKREEAAFMGFVASVRIEVEVAAAPRPSTPAPSTPSPSPTPSPSTSARPSAPSVDTTLIFSVPDGWTRVDVAPAAWLRAPSTDGQVTYIMLTPGERLTSDFATWYTRKLTPAPGMRILTWGAQVKEHVANGFEIVRQKLTIEVRGKERHEQDVLAIHKGTAAALVALDASSPQALDAHEAEFRVFIAKLDIKPELSNPPGQAQASSPSTAAPTGPQGFPGVAPPASWTLGSEDKNWRTYRVPMSNANAYCAMMVSQIIGSADPATSLNDMRRSLGFGGARTPETTNLPGGARLLRVIDPGGAAMATETVVLASGGRQVMLILRATTLLQLESQRSAFEQMVSGIKL